MWVVEVPCRIKKSTWCSSLHVNHARSKRISEDLRRRIMMYEAVKSQTSISKDVAIHQNTIKQNVFCKCSRWEKFIVAPLPPNTTPGAQWAMLKEKEIIKHFTVKVSCCCITWRAVHARKPRNICGLRRNTNLLSSYRKHLVKVFAIEQGSTRF